MQKYVLLKLSKVKYSLSLSLSPFWHKRDNSQLWYLPLTSMVWLAPQATNLTCPGRFSFRRPMEKATSSLHPWQCWPNSPHPQEITRLPPPSSGSPSSSPFISSWLKKTKSDNLIFKKMKYIPSMCILWTQQNNLYRVLELHFKLVIRLA